MKTTLDKWRQFLAENREHGSTVNRRRKGEDPPSVKKRKQPWEVFPGYDDRNGGLKQLANGITEEDDDPDGLLIIPPDDEDEEDIEEACLGNPYRDENGHYASASDHAVVTHGYEGENSGSDCKPGKWKKNKSGTSHKCGRDPSGKKHPYVCKSGQLREGIIDDNGEPYISLEFLRQVIESEASKLNEDANRQAMAQKCLQMGFTTPQKAFQNLTTTLNALHQSMKGDLGKPQK